MDNTKKYDLEVYTHQGREVVTPLGLAQGNTINKRYKQQNNYTNKAMFNSHYSDQWADHFKN